MITLKEATLEEGMTFGRKLNLEKYKGLFTWKGGCPMITEDNFSYSNSLFYLSDR